MSRPRTLSGIANAATGVAARASNQLVLLFITVVATRFLVPAEFGVFSVAAASITFVRTILYSGAFEYLLKAKDAREASTECLIVNAVAAIVLSLVLVVFASFSKAIFGTPEVGRVLMLMLPSNLIAMATAWQEALLLRGGKIQLYYMLTFATEVCSGLAALLLFEAHWGTRALIAQTYFRTLGLGLAYLAIGRPVLSTRLSLPRTIEVAKWSLSRYAAIFVGFCFNYGADFILGAFLSTAAAGLYRAGNRIATAVADLFAQPTRTFGLTLFSRRAAMGQSAEDLWPKILTASTVIGWPALAGLATVSGSLVPLVLGPKWVGVAPLVSILCLLKSFSLVSAVTNTLLVAFNRQRMVLVVQTTASVATVGALIVFARLGVEAAAWSITVASAGANIWLLVLAIGTFPDSRRALLKALPTVAAPALATILGAQACIALATWNAHPNKWIVTAIVVGGGAVAWAAASLPFRRQILQSVQALGGG